VISFDLTGTLATFRFCDSIYFEGLPGLYASRHGREIQEAQEYLKRCYDEVGDREADWYDIKYWFSRFELGSDWDELLKDLSHRIEFYPETESVLAELSREYELILITNACREFLAVEMESLRGHFRHIISCVSDFGEVKKTSRLYGHICRQLGLRPEEVTHVGDHWHFDFVAPRECGLTAFYLDRTGASSQKGDFTITDLRELKDRLI